MITITTTPLSTSDIQVDWAYSTFNEATNLEVSADGITYTPVAGSPFPKGTNSTIVSGLTGATRYWFRIKKTVWVAYSKANDDSATLLDFDTALSFDGVNDNVRVNGVDAVPFAPLTSGSMWVKFLEPATSTHITRFLFVCYNGGGGNSSFVGITEVNGSAFPDLRALSLELWTKTGKNLGVGFTIPDDIGVWFNIAWAVQPTGNTDEYRCAMTWNGVNAFQSIQVRTGGQQDFYGTTRIGGNSGGSSNNAVVIDQFAILTNEDLTSGAEEIYNDGKGIDLYQKYDPSKFLVYYDFNEGIADANNAGIAAPELIDRSGNGYTGTLNNFAKTGTTSNWVDSIDNAIEVFSLTPLTTTSITFTVTNNPDPNLATVIAFEYSKTSDFAVIVGSNATASSVVVLGLDINTKYYFRAQLVGMTGYFRVESSFALAADPLEVFGSDLIMWYRSDDYIANVGSISRTAQLNDRSGNGRHLTEAVTVNQPYNEAAGNDSGRSLLDGHIGQHVSSAQTITNKKRLSILPVDWGSPVSGDIVMITVMGGGTGAGRQHYHFSRNNVADGDSNFSNSPYSLFSGTSSAFFRYTSALEYLTQYSDLQYLPYDKRAIMSETKTDISAMSSYFNGVLESNVLDVTAATSIKDLDSFIMFGDPANTQQAAPDMTNWETFFIKGNYTNLAAKLNGIHEVYLSQRYPSLNIVSPNL